MIYFWAVLNIFNGIIALYTILTRPHIPWIGLHMAALIVSIAGLCFAIRNIIYVRNRQNRTEKWNKIYREMKR